MTESRGAMTAQQFQPPPEHISRFELIGTIKYWWERAVKAEYELSLSAHNTAQLQKEVERTKGYDAVLAEVGKLQGIVEAGDAENVELQAALEVKEKELADANGEIELVKELAKFHQSLFCEHSERYSYTEDGGKTIICLLCELSRLRSQGALIDPWQHIPEQYKVGRWAFDYDEKHSTFFVHCNGHRICDAEDLDVASAICNDYNGQSVRSQGAGQWVAGVNAAIVVVESFRYFCDGPEAQIKNYIADRIRHLKPPTGLASPPESKV